MKLMDPLNACMRMLSPTINLPASGDIGSFNYHPSTEWAAPSLWSGDAQIEQKVYRDVASPGSQLGTIIDALQVISDALVAQNPELANNGALTALHKLAGEVEAAKTTVAKTNESLLEKQLDALAENNKAALKRLVGRYKNIK